jgi:hypothetical protein
MFLKISPDGSAVKIGLPTVNDRYFTLSMHVPGESPIFARLLAADMNERFEKAVRLAREQAYASGWKDAKAKSAKRDYFTGWLDVV